MNDTQSQTESLLGIIDGIEAKRIMLPEFQRDFRWELDKTYDLIDSLIKDIFIGTIIYGKPAFALTLREIDTRPRKGIGSNAALNLHHYTKDEITKQALTNNLRIVLDGQQRITSIYRAVTGLDNVYIILRDDIAYESINRLSLEEIVQEVRGEESSSSISVKLSDAYKADKDGMYEEDLRKNFAKTHIPQFQRTLFGIFPVLNLCSFSNFAKPGRVLKWSRASAARCL